MLADSRPRRKAAGFIRTNSFKTLPTFKNQESVSKIDSSDDFSSFEKKSQPQQSDSEFSPYKSASPKMNLVRPPLPKQTQIFTNKKLAEGYQSSNYVTLGSPTAAHRGQQNARDNQIKEGMRKRAQVQRELQEINKICKQIDQFNPSIEVRKNNDNYTKQKSKSREKKQQSRQQYSFYQQQRYEDDSNNIHLNSRYKGQNNCREHNSNLRKHRQIESSKRAYNFQQSQDIDESPSFTRDQQSKSKRKVCKNIYQQNREQSWLKQRQNYLENQDGRSSKRRVQSHQKSVKSKTENKNMSQLYRAQIEHKQARQRFISDSRNSQTSEQSEELIQDYPTDEFAKRTIKQSIGSLKRSNNVKTEDNQLGILRAKGGICFDLDINQFTQPLQQNEIQKSKPVTTKNKKTNTKEQIMKRRQIAKNYDRYARSKVFGA